MGLILTWIIRLKYRVKKIIRLRGALYDEVHGVLWIILDFLEFLGMKVPILARYIWREQVIAEEELFIYSVNYKILTTSSND